MASGSSTSPAAPAGFVEGDLPGGRNLVQLPNVLYARKHLPQRSWIPGSTMVELVEHRWNFEIFVEAAKA